MLDNCYPFVLYRQIDETIANTMLDDDYESLGVIKDKPVKDCYISIVNEIDNNSIVSLIQNPPQIIEEFRRYVVSKIPMKSFFTIASTWPPVIPRLVPQVDAFIRLVIRMVSISNDPEKFIKWLATGLFPKSWVKTPSSQTPSTVASSLCTIDNTKKLHWAVIDSQSNFHMYQIIENSDLKEVFFDRASRTKTTADGKGVIVMGQTGAEIFKFFPTDSLIVAFWASIFEKKRPHFFIFLTEIHDAIPFEVFEGIYTMLSHPDMIALRSLINPEVVLKEEIPLIIDPLIDIMNYAQRTTIFIGSVFSIAFESIKTPDDVFSEGSLILSLTDAFVRRFISPYYKGFIQRLIYYIDSKECISVNDMHSFEVLFFTIIKYIVSSLSLLPPEIRHIASMLQAYASIKFNNKVLVLQLISEFYSRFLCEIISNPQKYDPMILVQHPNHLEQITKLLNVVIHLKPLTDEFAQWNRRLEKHTFAKIEDFLISISDIHYLSQNEEGINFVKNTAPDYPIPHQDVVVQSIRVLIPIISKNVRSFSHSLSVISTNKGINTMTLGWNFASSIQRYFKLSYEYTPPIEEPKQIEVPPVPNEVLPTENTQIEASEPQIKKRKVVRKSSAPETDSKPTPETDNKPKEDTINIKKRIVRKVSKASENSIETPITSTDVEEPIKEVVVKKKIIKKIHSSPKLD